LRIASSFFFFIASMETLLSTVDLVALLLVMLGVALAVGLVALLLVMLGVALAVDLMALLSVLLGAALAGAFFF
jgi:hypothetical protein